MGHGAPDLPAPSQYDSPHTANVYRLGPDWTDIEEVNLTSLVVKIVGVLGEVTDEQLEHLTEFDGEPKTIPAPKPSTPHSAVSR